MARPTKCKRQNKSRSTRAGLEFPVGRIHRVLKKGNYVQRVSRQTPVYLAAVLEYLTTEMLDLASSSAKKNKKCRIVPHDLHDAIRKDKELKKFLRTVTINPDDLDSDKVVKKRSRKCCRK